MVFFVTKSKPPVLFVTHSSKVYIESDQFNIESKVLVLILGGQCEPGGDWLWSSKVY